MTNESELAELLGNSSLLLQRTTRRVTQVFDRMLDPVGLTTNQFGLLANLFGISARGLDALRVGVFAERMGMDPTTLNRNLKPLEAAGLVGVGTALADKRGRTIHITDAGRVKLIDALPHWREAQAQLDRAIGVEARLALNALLDLADERLGARSISISHHRVGD